MKKLFVAGVMALGFFTASAQNKIGYINTDELIGIMPEAEKVDQELREYQESLAIAGQDMVRDFRYKDSVFSADSAKLNASMKEIKRNELIKLYQDAQNWNTKAQEMYQAEAQKKIAPLRDKAMNAVRSVAKESGYSYILDINAVIVGPPGDDVIGLVKKKLGIKDIPPANTKPGVMPKN
jgi:outer membrane protein